MSNDSKGFVSYFPGNIVACANLYNDILLYSIENDYVITKFEAHDDSISGMIFYNLKLVSFSMDQTIRIWIP